MEFRHDKARQVIIFADAVQIFFMNSPLVNAFFVGRALAEACGEQLENTVSQTMGDLGKFDAEQRERLRQFMEQVLEKANRDAEQAMQSRPGTAIATNTVSGDDLQTTIDELRAEIAQLRVELQRYRARSV